MIETIKAKIDANVLCIGIVCITIIEIVALLMGMNGLMFKSVIGIIALGVGISIPTPEIFKKKV